MIELRNVSKGFKGIELFRDVSLCIPDGKKIFIKGTNGSGKSVLLKMIIGFSRPDSGQILVNDWSYWQRLWPGEFLLLLSCFNKE